MHGELELFTVRQYIDEVCGGMEYYIYPTFEQTIAGLRESAVRLLETSRDYPNVDLYGMIERFVAELLPFLDNATEDPERKRGRDAARAAFKESREEDFSNVP